TGRHRADAVIPRTRGRRGDGAQPSRGHAAVTRLITTAVAVMVALAGCDAVPGRPKPEARELVPSEVMVFETLYARNCAGCHGQTGRLGAARALNDPVYLAVVPPERVRQVIAVGVPGTAQPAFALSAGGPLTDQQIEVLVRGIEERWRRPVALAGTRFHPTTEDGRAASPAMRI